MQCYNCKHKVVCRHFYYVNENLHIGIQVNDCKLYEQKFYGTASKKEKVSNENVSIIERDFSQGYADFSSLGKSVPISAIPVEISKVICDRCKKEVFSTEIDNCTECGRTICGDCRVDTFNPDLGTVSATCEKCWSGTEDPILGEDAEVSISFTEEKNEWDLTDFVDTKDTLKAKEETEDGIDNTKPNRKSKKK